MQKHMPVQYGYNAQILAICHGMNAPKTVRIGCTRITNGVQFTSVLFVIWLKDNEQTNQNAGDGGKGG